jgi:sulfur carrier protein
MTSVVLNGTAHDLPEGATVEAAVAATGAPADARGVAVALDGEVVPRGEWRQTPVREGQHVEVLHAVQGGA